MVKEIKEDGRLTIDPLVDLNIMRLKENIVRLKQTLAETYTGTICLHETSVHVYRENEKYQEILNIWKSV